MFHYEATLTYTVMEASLGPGVVLWCITDNSKECMHVSVYTFQSALAKAGLDKSFQSCYRESHFIKFGLTVLDSSHLKYKLRL